MTTYGILIFEAVEELDFVGPREVFGASAAARARDKAGVDIDIALWLIGRIHGRRHARFVRRGIQYEPAPPYTADEPLAS
jgi:hypothetical protein